MPQLSLHSPVGPLTVSEEAGAIVALDWGWGRDQDETPLLRRTIDALQAYFDGDPAPWDIPLAPAGTPYRRRVWAALRDIPLGEVRTYGAIAAAVGGSPRSVGGANAHNPIPIITPCHRVVAGNGIGGWSGAGDLETKRWLIGHESRIAAARARHA